MDRPRPDRERRRWPAGARPRLFGPNLLQGGFAAFLQVLLQAVIADLDRLGREVSPNLGENIVVTRGLEVCDDDVLGVAVRSLATQTKLFRNPQAKDPVTAIARLEGKAKKLGIVDLVIEERHVRNAVRKIADGEIDEQKPGRLTAAAFSLQPARSIAARQMRSKTGKKAPKGHYPAPYAVIDLWEEHGDDSEKMRAGEISSFAKLLVSETAQNLIRVFFLRENLKRNDDGESGVSHVHVIGAGAMGGEIAAWCAIRGFYVTLADLENEQLAKAINAAAKLCDETHLSGIEKRDALDRLIPDPGGVGVNNADLVIEAVPEKLDLKQRIYAAVEPKMKKGAILASNTSSLRLNELMPGLKDPSRFAGLHFFNPVSRMELVEIVSHDGTDSGVLHRLRAFTREIDRLPAPVKSYPGFLVNRALMPYLMEALVLLDEGVAKEVIDKAAEDFGMPMGPIEVADQVGLDICLHVAESLRENIEKPMPDIPGWLREKVEKGDLGRKSGAGFYQWSDGKPQRGKVESDVPPDLTDRLILPMLDACVECLRKDVVMSEDIVDGAMIFATGFAPFRGGPMYYARTRGIDDIVNTMKRLAEQHGDRFTPDAGWVNID
jgi:3-hydroxyacyl-CoA dehydrogenase/enoyl-CoA hydratase/3-hydroxybutyryl-CoA epimerase